LRRFYSLDGSSSTTVSVEELALQHYASDAGGGWCGLHSEGGVWATLFGLLLWDVLFMGECVAG
jgi:Fanconi-associated nuclease 1